MHVPSPRVPTVPTQFSYTQISVRGFFTATSSIMLIACAASPSAEAQLHSTASVDSHHQPSARRYTAAIASRSHREIGQLWVMVLLVLLIALNDPLYIARIYVSDAPSNLFAHSVVRPTPRAARIAHVDSLVATTPSMSHQSLARSYFQAVSSSSG